ncbi:hypothetical protein EX227_14200 [Providencia rettgeri]|uniref:Uncharacterized protein n=3 Tax=Providencia TaxID=586 RepID=A0AAP2NUP7_PRORE|nr:MULTISPECIES: hypothetical protein [Providencia]MBX6950043.1 hypothetical protein [Providencia rettgeri]MBX6956165.1 hypothetical protein [Providencia rettgeri]MBX6958495.1 hypothetical protein [Providencia rettgeri]MBX6971499.1 hypothetical protein [Providencia rettgeri]MBX6979489.1 hypothetical protein [Providencia rettgeri]
MSSNDLKKEKRIWFGVMVICAVFTVLETVSAVLHDRSVQDYILCGVPAGVLCFSTYKGLMKFAVVRQYQGIVLLTAVLASLPIVFIYSYLGEPVSYANRSYYPLIIFIAGFVMCGISALYVSTGKSILNPESN